MYIVGGFTVACVVFVSFAAFYLTAPYNIFLPIIVSPLLLLSGMMARFTLVTGAGA